MNPVKKSCELIATCPALNNEAAVHSVFRHPLVDAVRFNTGVASPWKVEKTVSFLKEIAQHYSKKLWIDIKGRQLRITKWTDPLYNSIEINHNIEIEYPAEIYFRNNETPCNITHVQNGNKIFVSSPPRDCVGAGQSVNILAKSLVIDNYLTRLDKEYLLCCKQQGVTNIMASFVEKYEDIYEIVEVFGTTAAAIVSKIESKKGLSFVFKYASGNTFSHSLMAARDDLFIEYKYDGVLMLKALKAIISKDAFAICASKIFTSLQHHSTVDWNDFADLEFMYGLGYRRFMLCDNVCNYAFSEAMEAWEKFVNA